MGQDCGWNNKEYHFGDIISPVPGDFHKNDLNNGFSIKPYSNLYSTCVDLGPLGPKTKTVLLTVPEEVSSNSERRSRSAMHCTDKNALF